MASVFFISSQAPTAAKAEIQYDKAFGNGRLALESATKEAEQKFGATVLIKNITDDKFGVFIDVQGNLALLCTYQAVAIPLMK